MNALPPQAVLHLLVLLKELNHQHLRRLPLPLLLLLMISVSLSSFLRPSSPCSMWSGVWSGVEWGVVGFGIDCK